MTSDGKKGEGGSYVVLLVCKFMSGFLEWVKLEIVGGIVASDCKDWLETWSIVHQSDKFKNKSYL